MSTTNTNPAGDPAEAMPSEQPEAVESAASGEQQCFANRHMRPEEFALWNLCRSLSYETGFLYFDGQDIAKMFAETGKDRVYRAAKSLTEKGWFKLLTPRLRNKRTGLWNASQYRILSAGEWMKEHPHTCDSGMSIPQNANGTIPQNKNGQHGIHSSKRERPFPITRTSIPQNATDFDKENLDTKEKPSAQDGAGSDSPFTKVRQFYLTEFERMNKITAPFDGRDGASLKKLLREQARSTPEEVIGWLKNAFQSSEQYPLKRGFRFWEFAAHYAKFVHGPLIGTRQTGRQYAEEARGKFDNIAVA